MAERIVIDPVTRIEGHAKISIFLGDDGGVTDAQFHVTEFRGFEKMFEGRPLWEMPAITARVCGICPVSHLTASAKAGDQILGVRLPPAAVKLRRFAKPETVEELVELLAGAEEEGLPVAAVGLGSNLLAADEGFPGLVLKLAGVLAVAKTGEDRLVAGGGTTLAVCLHRARAAGLGGLEFACAIPGTVGGGVWMNAGAYGGDIAGVLVRALVADSRGTRWRTPDDA